MPYLNFTSPTGIRDVNHNYAAGAILCFRNLLDRLVRLGHRRRTAQRYSRPRGGSARGSGTRGICRLA